jgi:transcriptional regulator with XRE-family HTH domain
MITKREPTSSGSDGEASSFGEEIKAAMQRKGWTQAETARQVSQRLPDGERFSAVNLAHYISGRSRPRPKYRDALFAALDLPPGHAPVVTQSEDERTRTREPSSGRATGRASSSIRLEDRSDGHVLLQVDVVLPWSAALQILEILKGAPTSEGEANLQREIR